MSSRFLNENNNLENYKNEIENFLEKVIPMDAVITMGNLKNGPMIQFIDNIGYIVNKKIQHPQSLYNSNRMLIRQNDLVIFLIYNNSANMTDFLEYAKEVNVNKIEVLNLS